LAQLKTAAAGLIVRESVLEHASAIEQVFHAIDGYRAARDSLPRLVRQRTELSETIRKLLAEVGSQCDVAQASGLLPAETLVARVQFLIDEHGRLTDRDEQLDVQIRTKEAAIERLKDSSSPPAGVRTGDKLETSLASVANVADLEARRRKLDQDIADQRDGYNARRRRLDRSAANSWCSRFRWLKWQRI